MFDIKFLVCLLFFAVCRVATGKNVVCYYSSWATYRSSTGKFDVANINTDLCTHVIYAFAGLERGSLVALDPFLDLPDNWGRDNYGAFTALKKINPKLKTILAVGGWNEGSAKYSVMASTAATRQVFISSAVSMLSSHGFDGLDLDWEYPNRRDTVHGEADIDNFSLLVKELREEFDKYGWFLSAAVSSVEAMASLSYDIPEISKHLDLINLMTYDMYGAWDAVTGHNAPLHKGIGDVGDPADLFTVDMALQYWIQQGAPSEKLAVGVPFYGRTFTLSSQSFTSVRAPASGPGLGGPFTATDGFIGYNEFCYKLQSESWNVAYDSLAKVPYAFSGQNWVSYDDADSVRAKVEYAKSLGVNNIMVWSIETDDFHGLCGDGDWPLLRSINNALDGEESTSAPPTTEVPSTEVTPESTSPTTEAPSTEATPESTSSTTEPPSTEATPESTSSTTEAPSTEAIPQSSSPTTGSTAESSSATTVPESTTSPAICSVPGPTHNPAECTSFYICVFNNNGGLDAIRFMCPEPLHWDQVNGFCNFPELANCIVG